MKIVIISVLILLLTSCALLQKNVDSDAVNYAPGFKYNYPKTGEWIIGNSRPGNIVIGKKSTDKGTSVLATVKYGPIGLTDTEMAELKKTGKIKAHSESEIISSFKTNLENEAKEGRVKKIKSNYEEIKYSTGSCLIFSQTGEDNGSMPISNHGKWCFNKKTYSYIMLNMSARVPEGQQLPSLMAEKTEFFNSLVFTGK